MTIHFNTTVLQYGGFSLLAMLIGVFMTFIELSIFFGRRHHWWDEFFQTFWIFVGLSGTIMFLLSIGGQIFLWITGGK